MVGRDFRCDSGCAGSDSVACQNTRDTQSGDLAGAARAGLGAAAATGGHHVPGHELRGGTVLSGFGNAGHRIGQPAPGNRGRKPACLPLLGAGHRCAVAIADRHHPVEWPGPVSGRATLL